MRKRRAPLTAYLCLPPGASKPARTCVVRAVRQLSSLDAQFLNVESARIYGHVAFLGVYDPSTAPGGKLGGPEVKALLESRLHLLPPLRWRLVEVPLGLDLPYWVEDPDFDLEFHIRETALPTPGDDRQLAETVQRVFGRPLDRGRPLWEIYVIHGLEGGRVALLTKIHHAAVDGLSGNEIMGVVLDPEPDGRVVDPAPAQPGPMRRSPRDRAMLLRGLRGVPRQPLRALRSLPADRPGLHRPAGRERAAGRADALARLLAGAPHARVRRVHGHPRGDEGAPAQDAVQRADQRAPALRVRLALAGLGPPDPARLRRDGQRRGRDAVRGRRARVAAGARRAARGPARGDDPDVRPPPRRARHVGQPDLDDGRADPDQRARPRAAPAPDARAAAQRQGAPQRAPGVAAHGRARRSSRPRSPPWRRATRWTSSAAPARR